MRLSLLLLALTLTAGACSTSEPMMSGSSDPATEQPASAMSSPASTVALGTPFALEKDTWVEVAEEDVEIRFDTIAEDSRCPANATCVWEGKAVAHFTLFEDGKETPFTLEMPGLMMEMPDSEQVTFQQVERFSIALYLLQPYPELAAESRMPATATLEVRRTMR